MRRRRAWRASTLVWLGVIVVGGLVVALGAGQVITDDDKLREFVQQASIALVFATVLGGWVKLLFDDLAEDRKRADADVEQKRVQRASRAQFLQAVLDDLKAVHDRVEQARLLIQAYRSAAAFRDEMRELVDARVRLLNVERALRTEQGARLTTAEADVADHVRGMAEFLGEVVGQFQDNYKPIADAQRVYEAVAKAREATWTGTEEPGNVRLPDNPAWKQITDLEVYRDFIRDPHQDDGRPATYREGFIDPLDKASTRLRSLLHETVEPTKESSSR